MTTNQNLFYTFANEKSCLTANVCRLQNLELLPKHYLC